LVSESEFLDINGGHRVVGADSWIFQSRGCSINTLVAGFLQAMGEKMLALDAEVMKCVTTWLIHTLVNSNLHEDSAMFEEGGFVLYYLVQTPAAEGSVHRDCTGKKKKRKGVFVRVCSLC